MGRQSSFVFKLVRLCGFLFLIGDSTAWGQVRPRVVQAVRNDQRITLKGNVHLKAPDGTPMANVMLTLLRQLGLDDMKSFGDSTGEFSLTAPAATSAA
jgi:hypothetical protein